MYLKVVLKTTFKANGTNYELITVGISRYEREALADNIKADPNLWKRPGSTRGMGVLNDRKTKE